MYILPRQYLPDNNHTVAFTGHREGGLPAGADRAAMMTSLCRALDILAASGFNTYINGGCYGFDLICAAEVIARRDSGAPLKLVTAVPFPEQSYRWSEADRAEYDRVIAASDTVVLVSDSYHAGAYAARNRFMVDCAGVLVAYCTESRGGTHGTLAYAAKKGVPVVNLSEAERKQL